MFSTKTKYFFTIHFRPNLRLKVEEATDKVTTCPEDCDILGQVCGRKAGTKVCCKENNGDCTDGSCWHSGTNCIDDYLKTCFNEKTCISVTCSGSGATWNDRLSCSFSSSIEPIPGREGFSYKSYSKDDSDLACFGATGQVNAPRGVHKFTLIPKVGVKNLPKSQQSLLGSETFTSTSSGSTLIFSKLLREKNQNELNIDASLGVTNLIFARGKLDNGSLVSHGFQGKGYTTLVLKQTYECSSEIYCNGRGEANENEGELHSCSCDCHGFEGEHCELSITSSSNDASSSTGVDSGKVIGIVIGTIIGIILLSMLLLYFFPQTMSVFSSLFFCMRWFKSNSSSNENMNNNQKNLEMNTPHTIQQSLGNKEAEYPDRVAIAFSTNLETQSDETASQSDTHTHPPIVPERRKKKTKENAREITKVPPVRPRRSKQQQEQQPKDNGREITKVPPMVPHERIQQQQQTRLTRQQMVQSRLREAREKRKRDKKNNIEEMDMQGT